MGLCFSDPLQDFAGHTSYWPLESSFGTALRKQRHRFGTSLHPPSSPTAPAAACVFRDWPRQAAWRYARITLCDILIERLSLRWRGASLGGVSALTLRLGARARSLESVRTSVLVQPLT